MSSGTRAEAGAILMYHRVARVESDIHGIAMDPAEFRAQMEELARDYHPTPLAAAAAAVSDGGLPERAVAVTFDDATVDHLEVVSPILIALRIPATFFVPSEGLTHGRLFWWDTLEATFFGRADLPTELTIELGGQSVTFPTGTPAEREAAHWAIYQDVRMREAGGRDEAMARLREWAAPAPGGIGGAMSVGPTPPMSLADLIELASRPGHTIGGHTVHHLSLSHHRDEVVQREIRENRLLLEAATGRTVSMFAYPYGDHDERVANIARRLGYRAAVTTVPTYARPGTDPLKLPRFAAPSAGPLGPVLQFPPGGS